ncbi:MAG TPA: adenylate/guanylate cyclase domain-containing protein [Nocardioidaceae bacterium]|nr:adenylate/guanylate cyclase domain-containing protein [Nocardioidaceae bacterium]
MDTSPTLLDEVERTLLGGNRRYTRLEVAERAGVSVDRAQELWRALGFASTADDEVVFTDEDVEALGLMATLVSGGVVDPRAEASLARSLGQPLARLAEWQTTVVREVVADPDQPLDAQPQLVRAIEALLPVMERLQSYVWRRHLAAAAGRMLADPGSDPQSNTLVVGFADIVDFTRTSRTIEDADLAEFVDYFEGTAAAIVAERHGRVIKTIGDEVLFVADTPRQGADLALELAARSEEDADFPTVRVGLAYGPVLSQLGDVYGPVVNVAARLTSVARPETVVVDRELAAALEPESDLQLRKIRRVTVRGYRRLEPWALRRAADPA